MPQDNNFDKAKRWGKKFLADWKAGAGDGTGRSRTNQSQTPKGDIGYYSARPPTRSGGCGGGAASRNGRPVVLMQHQRPLRFRLWRTRLIGLVVPVVLASGGLALVGQAPATAAAVSLGVGEQLGPGEQISSPDGQYALVMQTDGNVVERAQDNQPVWSSATGEANSVLQMQSDGNLVVIAPGNRPVWSTNTAGNPGSDLELQDDGNLVVYAQGHRAVWTSFAHGSTLAPAPTVPAPQPGSEPSSDCVATNECVATPRPLGTSEATPGATASEISRTDIPVIPALGRYRVGFFIMQKSYGILGITGAGDGRGFDPQMDPSQNRIYLELDYTDGTARIVVNPSCNPERTSCTNPVPLTSGRVSISVSRANVSSDNPITFTDFHVDIENSRETIDGFPRIRAEISFDTNPQGGLSVVGHTSSFPSVEIYHDTGASTDTVYTHEQSQLAGAAALGIPALDQSFGINVTADGFVDRAY